MTGRFLLTHSKIEFSDNISRIKSEKIKKSTPNRACSVADIFQAFCVKEIQSEDKFGQFFVVQVDQILTVFKKIVR